MKAVFKHLANCDGFILSWANILIETFMLRVKFIVHLNLYLNFLLW